VSGFLDRMAARATGDNRSDATPWVPSRFEPTDGAGPSLSAADGLAAPRTGSPTPPPPGSLLIPPPVAQPVGQPVAQSGAHPGVEPADDAVPLRAARETGPTPQVAFAGTTNPPVPAEAAQLGSPTSRAARTGPDRIEVPTERTPPARPPATAARLAVAVPAVPARSAPVIPQSEQGRVASRGPDVVRISIGRVDVRAPAPQPRPAPAAPTPPAAKLERLSLQDYLHGHREAR